MLLKAMLKGDIMANIEKLKKSCEEAQRVWEKTKKTHVEAWRAYFKTRSKENLNVSQEARKVFNEATAYRKAMDEYTKAVDELNARKGG